MSITTVAAAPVNGTVTPSTPTPTKRTEGPPAPRLEQDTVTLSSAGAAALASLKEANESVAVTASEAAKGDHQAQQLLAREAARQAPSE